MKRILLSVFAAAITAAWVAPAMAADVSFNAEYRLRSEFRNESDFNKNTEDNMDFWGQRVRLTTNVKASDDTSLKITLQDTRYWGASGATATTSTANIAGGPAQTDLNTNTVDLHESYVNVNNFFIDGLAFRAGRQELAYGDQRLIGANNWNNGGRSFDALKFAYGADAYNVDFILSKLYDNQGSATATASGVVASERCLYGIYGTIKNIANNSLDLYVLGVRDNSNAVYDDPAHIYTYGARLKGAVAGLDYTAEVPFQSGAVSAANNTTKIGAWAMALKAGYTIPSDLKFRVGVEYDYASGDKDSTDNKINTFNNLFPTNHDKMGLMDLQGWRNVKAWNLNASLEPTAKTKVTVSYWNFDLANKHDSWYNAAGTAKYTPTVGTPANFSNGRVGSELDLTASYKYNSTVTFEAGLARFFAGKLIKDQVNTATTDNVADQDWAYLQMTANF